MKLKIIKQNNDYVIENNYICSRKISDKLLVAKFKLNNGTSTVSQEIFQALLKYL